MHFFCIKSGNLHLTEIFTQTPPVTKIRYEGEGPGRPLPSAKKASVLRVDGQRQRLVSRSDTSTITPINCLLQRVTWRQTLGPYKFANLDKTKIHPDLESQTKPDFAEILNSRKYSQMSENLMYIFPLLSVHFL